MLSTRDERIVTFSRPYRDAKSHGLVHSELLVS